jgi:hypothetical protein
VCFTLKPDLQERFVLEPQKTGQKVFCLFGFQTCFAFDLSDFWGVALPQESIRPSTKTCFALGSSQFHWRFASESIQTPQQKRALRGDLHKFH